jgi:hypothetical protein
LRDSENTTKNLVTIVGAPPRFEMITFQKWVKIITASITRSVLFINRPSTQRNVSSAPDGTFLLPTAILIE